MNDYSNYVERSECEKCGKRNFTHTPACIFNPNRMADRIEQLERALQAETARADTLAAALEDCRPYVKHTILVSQVDAALSTPRKEHAA